MPFINIESIALAVGRQRREFKEKELQELVNSIDANGLLHPVVLRQEAGKFVLVAGERRIRAIRDIYDLGGSIRVGDEPVPPMFVPYTSLGKLSAEDAEEAELEENIRRVDLTWQERATATTRLLDLRTRQAAKKGLPAPTVSEIAQETRDSSVGRAYTETREDIILARSLSDADVAAAKTPAEALKVIKKKEEAARNTALGQVVGKTFHAGLHTLVRGDSMAWMQGVMADSYDVILTDPPYGMGADEFGDSGTAERSPHFYDDSGANFLTLMKTLPAQLFRLAKPDAHLYLFFDIDWFIHLKTEFNAAGWKVFRTPLIWHKPGAFRAPWPEMGPQRKYETILYAVKGSLKVNKLAPDVVTYPPDSNLGHQAQKPVALFADLLARSVRPGMSVFDPFCGTGPIFPAAHALQCRATGIEQDEAAHGIAVGRIQQLAKG